MSRNVTVDRIAELANDWRRDRDNIVKLNGAESLVGVAPTNGDFLRTLEAHTARLKASLPPMTPEVWEALSELIYATKNSIIAQASKR